MPCRRQARTASASRHPPHGGCIFAEDPARPAAQALAFWRSDADPHVVAMHAEPCPGGIDVLALDGNIAVLVEPDAERLLIPAGPGHLRIDVVGGTIFSGPIRPLFTVDGAGGMAPQLLTLRRFAGLVRGAPCRRLWPPLRRATRLEAMLRAHDAHAAGASHRDIAGLLYGRAGADERWSDNSRFMRLRIQRVLRSARRMIEGSYRTLLGLEGPL